MLKVSINSQGTKELEKHIKVVEKFLSIKGDSKFNQFIQEKVLQTLNQVMQSRLTGGTTNDDAISLYMNSNHIENTSNGFILYNDCSIPANSKYQDSYPDGQFSIALAFEYGVGIIGQNTDVERFIPWDYNVNDYNFGWFFKASDGKYHQTGGYTGFEIYRYTADEVERNLNKWVKEYYDKEV